MTIADLLKGLGKGLNIAGKSAGAGTEMAAKHGASGLLWYVGPTVAINLMGHGTREEKAKALSRDLTIGWATLGMGPMRQMLWGGAFSLASSLPMMTRGIIQGYRSSLESRTSLAIPFSHSNIPVDQAFATLRYAQERLNGAYTNLGGEATFFAAKYTR